MTVVIEYSLNRASLAEIADHLARCDVCFVPALSERVDINSYAQKLASKAIRFEAWSGDTLVGLVAAYYSDQVRRVAYITNVSVVLAWTGRGIARRLMSQCVEYAKGSGMRQINLEVARDNTRAIALYEDGGFVAVKRDAPSITMELLLESRDERKEHA
jgi:ribosomal protein S18 acetylase RimI-like enzyme